MGMLLAGNCAFKIESQIKRMYTKKKNINIISKIYHYEALL